VHELLSIKMISV